MNGNRRRPTVWVLWLLLGLTGSFILPGYIENERDSTSTELEYVTNSQAHKNYGKLPLSFEVNQGQTDKRVKFLSQNNHYRLFLTPEEAVLGVRRRNFREPDSDRREPASPPTVRMKLMGADSGAQISGLEPLSGKVNYFIGNDPAYWQTNVPTYAKVKYREIYPGIDLVYYGNQQQLEYDFIVARCPRSRPAKNRA
jgi:hypothetical protein